MKYPMLAVSLCTILFLGAGCQGEKTSAPSLPPAIQELQTQPAPDTTKQETRDPAAIQTPTGTATMLYRGSWFDATYPQTFSAAPTAPTDTYNGLTFVQTDEATFTSPEGNVEFFVYSPLWSGNPQNYLNIASTEELVDEKTEEKPENGPSGGTKTRWVTIKAKDSSYYRSFISIQRQLGTGSELHHVLGIKYRDAAAYETYKSAYTAFKQSLRQYAD